MVIFLGPNTDSWEPTTLPLLEEDFKYSPKTVEIVTA
jgi:hypothetical protein